MESEIVAWRTEAERFDDVLLMAELRRFARMDRGCEARILVLLAEVDERKLFLAQGYSSLFQYAVSVLRMSEAQAYLRIGAARVARSYPLVLEMFVEGALSLSAIKVLAPQLTAENHVSLFERARGRSKREVELLVAEIAPKPDVKARVRKLPARLARVGSAQAELAVAAAPNQCSSRSLVDVATRRAGASPDGHEACAGVSHAAAASHVATAPHAAAAMASANGTRVASAVPLSVAAAHRELSLPLAAAAASVGDAADVESAPVAIADPVADSARRGVSIFALEAPRAACAVLSPGRYKLEMTVDQATFDQVMTLKHLLKHRVPNGDLGVILGVVIAESAEKLRKQRFAQLSKPAAGARERASRSGAAVDAGARTSQKVPHGGKVKRRSRYVPRAVVREVFARDGAQCTFVSDDGLRCAERGMLELHHDNAFARGGTHTPENLRVVCHSHNGYFATLDFGAEHMRLVRVQAR